MSATTAAPKELLFCGAKPRKTPKTTLHCSTEGAAMQLQFAQQIAVKTLKEHELLGRSPSPTRRVVQRTSRRPNTVRRT